MVEKLILGSGVRERIEYPGIVISSYKKSEYYSNIMVENTDPEKTLKVFIGLAGDLFGWKGFRKIPARQVFKFRKIPIGNLSIEWFHY